MIKYDYLFQAFNCIKNIFDSLKKEPPANFIVLLKTSRKRDKTNGDKIEAPYNTYIQRLIKQSHIQTQTHTHANTEEKKLNIIKFIYNKFNINN